LPNPERTEIWFGQSERVFTEIQAQFQTDVEAAAEGAYDDWVQTPRGCLALMILLDQFYRKLYRGVPQEFSQEQHVLQICFKGLELHEDHALSLIERVFFYMPMQRVENLEVQRKSVEAYELLLSLSLSETQELYKAFLTIAMQRLDVMQRFERFPERNQMLGRESTAEEIEYLA